MALDPIVQQMIDDANEKLARGEIIAHRRFDPEIVNDMIEQERSGMDRRQHLRSDADRRKAEQ